MILITAKFTVFFEDPFWVGIYERQTGRKLEVCKITFGTEPKDYDVYRFLKENWSHFTFSPPMNERFPSDHKINPKRMQREISRHLQDSGVGTKAQQALKLQQEQQKLERKSVKKKKTEEEKDRKFQLRQQKKKEKHKGR